MTVTLDVCDHPLFMRLARSMVQYYYRTYYEADDGEYTEDITQAKEFTQGNIKFYKTITDSGYRVADKEFRDINLAIEYSMVMLILTYGFGGFKVESK